MSYAGQGVLQNALWGSPNTVTCRVHVVCSWPAQYLGDHVCFSVGAGMRCPLVLLLRSVVTAQRRCSLVSPLCFTPLASPVWRLPVSAPGALPAGLCCLRVCPAAQWAFHGTHSSRSAVLCLLSVCSLPCSLPGSPRVCEFLKFLVHH